MPEKLINNFTSDYLSDRSVFPETVAFLRNLKEILPTYCVAKCDTGHSQVVQIRISIL